MEKTCKICGKTKSLEDFPKDKKMADGHVHQCRVCVSARQKKYKSKPENKEHIRKSKKAWNIRNDDRVRRTHKAWKKKNPDKVKANAHAKRARKRGAPIDWKSTNELEEYWISVDIDPWRCYYCSCEMIEKPYNGDPEDRHIEHMIPLCRNGTSLKENLVPSCVACNQAKHSMTAEEFIGKTNE